MDPQVTRALIAGDAIAFALGEVSSSRMATAAHGRFS